MTSKRFFCSALFLLAIIPMAAQEKKALGGESEYKYDESTQLWLNTRNAAGIGIDSTRNYGYAEMGVSRKEGDYHRVQEGTSVNRLSFSTERLQTIGKYLYGYGSFTFEQGRTKERAWSDVMRTYWSSPFFSGSDVNGRYDDQSFDLTAKVGTVAMNGWRAGATLDYKVGDLSRLRDPRSRNRLLDYQLTPAITYTIGKNTIGLAGYYHRRKEKMPSLVTVQKAPNIYYYQMSGMEAAVGTMNGYSGFQREYVNHVYGAEMEYGFKGTTFKSVNSIGIRKGTDYIFEQYKREPGRYYNYVYDFLSQNRIMGGKVVHEIDVDARFEQGYADEYRPQLIITSDPETGYNSYHYETQMTYKKRYQIEMMDISMRYRANFLTGESGIGGYAGIKARMNSIEQKHLLPLSTFDLRTTDITAEMGKALLKDNRLWVELNAGYMMSQKADLTLADMDGAYAQQVLLKDLCYYDANCMHGGLEVKYQFPLTIKKTRSMWYAKAFAETFRAQHSMQTNVFGIKLGIFN